MNMRLAGKSPRLLACLLAVACFPPATETRSDEPDKPAPPTADSMLGNEVGQVRDDNGLKLKLLWCPPGKFTMGSPKLEGDRGRYEGQVEVTLTKGFWLGKYEVTESEWTQVMGSEPWKFQVNTEEGDDIPATHVSWEDAAEFCHKLTERERKAARIPEGWEYTLPTEAQWEYACRAGTETRFSFGDDESKVGEFAWFSDNAWKGGQPHAHRVGQKKPNPWGLCDMHGNVKEGCRDWSINEPLLGGRDPEVTSKGGKFRVTRGGCWGNPAHVCRSARQSGSEPNSPLSRNGGQGFRVALSPSGNK